METTFYKIRAITNLHVGAGDAGFGVIDNLVQRDVVTGLPVIHGSSLKGALREFFENNWGKEDKRITGIFGNNDNSAGFRFLQASLLALPVRSNKKPYFLGTSPEVMKHLGSAMKDHQVAGFDLEPLMQIKPGKGKPVVFIDPGEPVVEEFDELQKGSVSLTESRLLGMTENLAVFEDEDFKDLCSDTGLPVIARNKVGENKNLWYEQVVPRESLFWFAVMHNNEHFGDFNDLLTGEKSIVHIGANATVGYGFTKISKI